MKKRALLVVLALMLSLVLGPGTPRPGIESAGAEPEDGPAAASLAEEPTALGPAVFPHDEHVELMGIECATCHHETNAAPLSFPHQDYFDDFWIDCTICHHESDTGALAPHACSECHHSQGGDIADETLSAKVVIHKKCWSCHAVGIGAEASSICKSCHASRS